MALSSLTTPATRLLSAAAIFAALSMGSASLARADTAIETETAQIGKKGEIGFSQAYEYVKAKDGTSGGTLTQFEYGVSDRAEILIEPFFFVWDHPDGGPNTRGLGDLEITPSYEVVVKDGWVPAILTAFKLKVPMGSESAGGSGKFDYLPYLIFGQHYDGWTFNANVGVNVVTPPDGEKWGKTVTWAVETEREIAPELTWFLEGFSTEDHTVTASTALEYEWTSHLATFGAAGYNENHEGIFRVGFNLDY